MDREVLVYADLFGTPHLVGRLWTRLRKDRESATFEYEKSWLAHPDRYALEPALQLGPGPFHAAADQPLFGAIGDSAPDRWGRILMRRAERRRAEREGTARVPFLSAMSMLGARDNEPRSYLEFVDVLRQHGAAPHQDMKALWRRIVFSILISNTDDHLRNHGFLYVGGQGWRISPAYDLNPVPTDIKPRVLTTFINFDDGTASLNRAYEVAEYFELEQREARRIARDVGGAVATWRAEAVKLAITKAEIERMASAFEHEDLQAATGRRKH